MSAPADGGPVPGEHRVLRLPAPPKDFVPDGWAPTWLEINPSSEDKRHAEQTKRPVRVSVWDATLTTKKQALGFRGRPTVIISALVTDVLAAGGSAVVYDRLEPPDRDLPGSDGHAGIEGLVRPDGEQKHLWKARLQRIADVFRSEQAA